MAMAESADTPAEGLRMMKAMAQDFLSMPFDSAPMRFWRLLFPLSFRPALDEYSKQRDQDPLMLEPK